MENPLIKMVDKIEKGERQLINELNKDRRDDTHGRIKGCC